MPSDSSYIPAVVLVPFSKCLVMASRKDSMSVAELPVTV